MRSAIHARVRSSLAALLSVSGVVGIASCGGDDAAPGGGGTSVTCGAGTMLEGNQCVLADADGGAGTGGNGGQAPDAATGGSGGDIPDAATGGSGGDIPDGGEITCGPGTVLVGNECLPDQDAAEAGLPPAGEILFFSADKLWGDAPLDTTLSWEITDAPSNAVCDLDLDGDGTFETAVTPCNGEGTSPVTIANVGPVDVALRISSPNGEVVETERLFSNQIDWAPNVVRVAELQGLQTSVAQDTQVTLTFGTAANIPTLAAGDVLFDRSAEGYVRKVVSWQANGPVLEVQTEAGSLQDLATGGFYGVRNDDDGMSTLAGGAECDPRTGLAPGWAMSSGSRNRSSRRARLR